MVVTHYDILEIESSATTAEVRQAFKKLALVYHPDKRPEAERTDAANNFKLLQAAYEVLSDPAARKCYDVRMGVKCSPTHQAPNAGRSSADSRESTRKTQQRSAPRSPPSPPRYPMPHAKTTPLFKSGGNSFSKPGTGYSKAGAGSDSKDEWDRSRVSEHAAATDHKVKAKAKAKEAAAARRSIDESLRKELRADGVEYQDRLQEYFKKVNRASQSHSAAGGTPSDPAKESPDSVKASGVSKNPPQDTVTAKAASGAADESEADHKGTDSSCVIT